MRTPKTLPDVSIEDDLRAVPELRSAIRGGCDRTMLLMLAESGLSATRAFVSS
jgi:hypothetical protein